MTQRESITSTTTDFLNTHTFNSVDDFKNLRNDLLDATNDGYDVNNVTILNSNDRWRHEKDIIPLQVAMVINHEFIIKDIEMVDNKPGHILREIYIDDKVIEIVGKWCEKYRGTYRNDDVIFDAIIDCIDFGIAPTDKEKVKKYLTGMAEHVKRTIDEDLIPVGNGVFNYKTKELEPFSPDRVFISKASTNYNPAAANPHFICDNGDPWDCDTWFYDTPDNKDCVEFLKIQVPLILLRFNKKYGHAVFLQGNAGCGGKGTVLHLWRKMLGDGNHCSIMLPDFDKEFYLEPLLSCTAILTDENPVGAFVQSSANFKSIVTCDAVGVNQKFKEIVTFTYHGGVVMCCNEIPKFKDKSDSLFRRQIYVKMTKSFDGAIEKPEIKNRFMEDPATLEYIMRLALESNYDKLDIPESCNLTLAEVKEVNDPVRQFWNEFREDFKWDLLPFTFLYDLYKAWNLVNNPSGIVLGKTTFTSDLLDIIRKDADWICEDKSKKISVTKTNMAEFEPLILEYDLRTWMSPSYKGTNKKLLAAPILYDKYRGIVRVGTASADDDA